jgi:hypothetical protein
VLSCGFAAVGKGNATDEMEIPEDEIPEDVYKGEEDELRPEAPYEVGTQQQGFDASMIKQISVSKPLLCTPLHLASAYVWTKYPIMGCVAS